MPAQGASDTCKTGGGTLEDQREGEECSRHRELALSYSTRYFRSGVVAGGSRDDGGVERDGTSGVGGGRWMAQKMGRWCRRRSLTWSRPSEPGSAMIRPATPAWRPLATSSSLRVRAAPSPTSHSVFEQSGNQAWGAQAPPPFHPPHFTTCPWRGAAIGAAVDGPFAEQRVRGLLETNGTWRWRAWWSSSKAAPTPHA